MSGRLEESQREKSEMGRYETAASLWPKKTPGRKKVALARRREGITRKTRGCSSTVRIVAVSAVNQLRAAYWLPALGLPAFRMEVAAAKMRAALWLGISFSVLSQC